jgi:predicted small lipoprotein YifL
MTMRRLFSFMTALMLLSMAGCGYLPGLRRTPGAKLAESPARVSSDYDCPHRRLPFVEVNAVEVTPSVVAPGSSFNQRIIYSACLPRGRSELPVRLRTQITMQGAEMLRDVQPQFMLRPGRWIVDATVSTPPSARAGLYRVQIEISGLVTVDSAALFTVRH